MPHLSIIIHGVSGFRCLSVYYDTIYSGCLVRNCDFRQQWTAFPKVMIIPPCISSGNGARGLCGQETKSFGSFGYIDRDS